MTSPPLHSPRILVSVRNLAEARIVAQAGISLIDVKEPDRGSLGQVNIEVLQEISSFLTHFYPSVLLSAAGGELREFILQPRSEPVPPLAFFKLGLAGMRHEKNWRRIWEQARDQIFECCPQGMPRPGWIAVAYADEEAAAAPPVEEIVEAAISSQCAGVLFDTSAKTGKRLTELVPLSRMQKLLNRLHEYRLLGAVAGQLHVSDLAVLRAAGADIAAFRSAVCRERNRTAELDLEMLQRLVDA